MDSGFWTTLTQGITSARHKNVLQPLLWILGVSGAFLLFFVKLSPAFALACFIVFVVLLAYALVAYGYFGVTAPDRLQTETFQLKKMRYQAAIESSRGIIRDPALLETSTNPALPFTRPPDDISPEGAGR